MSQNWSFRTLDELGYVSRGRSRHRPRDAVHLYGGPYPFVQTGDIKHAELYLSTYNQTYSEAGLAQSRLWREGTLCITIAANIADTAILGVDACFPDSVIGFVPNDRKADVRFIKYLFDAKLRNRFRKITQGAAQDNLSQSKLLALRFLIPDIREQRGIADVLSAYDDLIENNRRRIVLLEQAAHELYREWFVRLRFPGHKNTRITDGLPVGWERANLGDIVAISKGKNITKDLIRKGDVPVVAGGLSPAYYHDTPNVLGPVVTISASGANAGYVNIYHEDIWASDCSFISASHTKALFYFYLLLRDRQREIMRLQKGAAQPHVYPKDLARLVVLIPRDEIMDEFLESASASFGQMGTLNKHTVRLIQAREILLPRLMSGEVAV